MFHVALELSNIVRVRNIGLRLNYELLRDSHRNSLLEKDIEMALRNSAFTQGLPKAVNDEAAIHLRKEGV